jgi:hypothetical protein
LDGWLGEHIVFKIKARVLVFAVLAITAVGAFASASASAAPQWLINGTPFKIEEAISAKVAIPGDLLNLITTLTGGAQLIIGCTTFETIGGAIFENNKNKAAKIIFKNCKVDTPKECKVKEPITAENVTSEAVDLGGVVPVFIPFSPTPPGNGVFAKITLLECSAEGVFNVTGKTVCEVLVPTTQQVEKLCQFKEIRLSNSLKFGVQTARLEGTVGFTLTGSNKGKPWGVNP